MSRRRNPDLNMRQDQNPFAMSTGDMMSVLMFVFVLLIVALIWNTKQSINDYQDIRKELYEVLNEEFKDSLTTWGAELDSNLTVRFNEVNLEGTPVLFEVGKDIPSDRYKSIMQSFFPKYLDILYREKYRDKIEEIRVEGHTDSTKCIGCKTIEDSYLYNMNLSQRRSQNVLKYGLTETSVSTNSELMEFSRKNIIATGLSFSQPRHTQDLSRRVEFRVRTKAEEKINEIIKSLNGK